MIKKMTEATVRENLKSVWQRIEKASKERPAEFQDVTPRLLAVSKTKPVEDIIEVYNAGQRHFGENYVQELVDKATNPEILEKCKEIRWHFIGHLQNNKINKILPLPNLYIIETVDSEKLASKLNQSWPNFRNSDSKLNVMIQINTSGEEEKNGIKPDEVTNLADFVLNQCPNLRLDGLMTIGMFGYDLSNGPNPDFICLKKCRDEVCEKFKLDCKDLNLSMGMSNDFEHAIAMGSTNVRVGTTIFGVRQKKN
ncbi:pyridoxal phosphate homeostasis protein-like [Sitophilus oryzae]|uniref:Pyridoxal phosphate homeostasis protein n=1 Tax=Sitophilus oryzae TaxID=7048 RepID=A0A6J2Y6H7_SITOR|nr:pyridoxal phosphate homeostasis protein-like [Sitophilus oryzae]XP_030759222.1 pyridoxal phosphate homeostasis protein-like [Sitophilus oryzae]